MNNVLAISTAYLFLFSFKICWTKNTYEDKFVLNNGLQFLTCVKTPYNNPQGRVHVYNVYVDKA